MNDTRAAVRRYKSEAARLRVELDEFHAKNFAPMSRINRAERVAENAVKDKRTAEAALVERMDEAREFFNRSRKAEIALRQVEALLDWLDEMHDGCTPGSRGCSGCETLGKVATVRAALAGDA